VHDTMHLTVCMTLHMRIETGTFSALSQRKNWAGGREEAEGEGKGGGEGGGEGGGASLPG
jgi:hypothetical protein